jgi:hypothetical protein
VNRQWIQSRSLKMKVYNFSSPLSASELEQLKEKIGEFEEVIVDVVIDAEKDIEMQIARLLTGDEWEEIDYFIPAPSGAISLMIGAMLMSAADPTMIVMPRMEIISIF